MNDTEQSGWSRFVNDQKTIRVGRIVLVVIVIAVISIVTIEMTRNSSEEKLTYVGIDISMVMGDGMADSM